MQQHAIRLQYKVAKDKLLARKVVLLLRHILSTLFANAILLLRHHRHRQSFAASFKRLIYFGAMRIQPSPFKRQFPLKRKSRNKGKTMPPPALKMKGRRPSQAI
ncbi:hypothetical protein VA599_10845 [Chromobacterium sp. TRC.1.1.SA]|uniref:Transposase DDE domain-containing protein n=1 Tax=Chromobacterium indicum TaxID=3110228 RepID=A0ABV0CMI5_9NEIS